MIGFHGLQLVVSTRAKRLGGLALQRHLLLGLDRFWSVLAHATNRACIADLALLSARIVISAIALLSFEAGSLILTTVEPQR